MNTQKKNISGFTLIEAMIAVVIIALLAAMAFPPLLGLRDKYYVQGAAEQMLGRLAEARLSALNRNQNVSVNFDDLIDEFSGEATLSDPTFGDIDLEPKLALLADASAAGSVDITRGNFTLRFGVTPVGQGFICDPEGGAGYPACEAD